MPIQEEPNSNTLSANEEEEIVAPHAAGEAVTEEQTTKIDSHLIVEEE